MDTRDEQRAPVPGVDKFTTEAEALDRAEELGCEGTHTMDEDGQTIFMPCSTHAVYDELASMAEGRPYHTDEDKKKNKDRRDVVESPGGGLPDHYRPATSPDVPEGRACGNCFYFNEQDVAPDGRARCMQWGEYVSGGFVCNAWKARSADKESRPYHDDEDEDRQEPKPAPKSEQITGSDKNAPGSAGGAGGSIKLSAATETALRNKVSEHNETMTEQDKPSHTRTTYGQLAAVYRRGSGAYSSSHRPGVSRAAWSMARVNAYLHLLRTGSPKNPKYVTDNDLLPSGHPKSTRDLDFIEMESREVDLTVPAYMQAAARQGLEFHADGKSGAGVVDRTIREARALAEGNVTEDKVVRASAWAARHRPDLDATGARPSQDGYPTPGAVAHLLWGIPTGERYSDAVAFFDRKSEQVKENRGSTMDVTPVKPKTPGSGVEFRSTTFEMRNEPDENTFVGYAAMFDSASQPLPFVERIERGAFERSLRERRRDIRLYVNHNSDLVLASKRSGTLRLTEDDRGLRVDADLPDTTYANDLRALMRAGVVDKMSFGFTVPKGGDRWSADGGERTLTKINLHEVSVVTGFPAYEQTQAAVRSLERLSDRTGLAIDDLTSALDALADGDELDADKAELLMSAIKESAGVAPQPNLIGLKQKHVDLLAKKVW